MGRFWRVWLGIGLWIVISLTVQAQDEQSLPVPETLFTDHVELKNVFPIVDAEHRTLRVFVDNKWKVIAYPDDFSVIRFNDGQYKTIYDGNNRYTTSSWDVWPRSDGMFWVAEGLESYDRGGYWVVDPEAGTFTRFQSKCRDDHEANAQSDTPRIGWMRITTREETYFCDTLTGTRTRGLSPSDDWSDPSESPDGRYLILTKENSFDDYGFDKYGPTQLYSYNLETGTILYLGDVYLQMADNKGALGWITPTVYGYSTRDMPEWSVTTYYAAHVNRRDSYQEIIAKSRFAPRYIENPPSFENQPEELNDGPSAGPCILEVFDLTTFSSTIYPMGTLCDYGVIIPDGTGDRLYHARYPSAGLVRYNHITGQRRNIFVGEIEGLGSVSPQGHYARIGLDASGVIDSVQDPDNDPYEYTGDWPLIIRLSDGALMGYVPYDAEWLSDQHLRHDNTLYTITSQGIATLPMPTGSEIMLTMPETGHMIVRTKAGEYGLYSLYEQRMTSLFVYDGPYQVRIEARTPDTFHVEFLEEVSVIETDYGYSDHTLRRMWQMDFQVH